jgi:hypothetical protein
MRSPHFLFLSLALLLLGVASPASAVPVTFNDINLQARGVSIYEINETGTYLVSTPGSVTSNMTIDLDPTGSYQIIIEPSYDTWFDDPKNALTYFIHDAAGQTIVFMVFAFVFIGVVKLMFR